MSAAPFNAGPSFPPATELANPLPSVRAQPPSSFARPLPSMQAIAIAPVLQRSPAAKSGPRHLYPNPVSLANQPAPLLSPGNKPTNSAPKLATTSAPPVSNAIYSHRRTAPLTASELNRILGAVLDDISLVRALRDLNILMLIIDLKFSSPRICQLQVRDLLYVIDLCKPVTKRFLSAYLELLFSDPASTGSSVHAEKIREAGDWPLFASMTRRGGKGDPETFTEPISVSTIKCMVNSLRNTCDIEFTREDLATMDAAADVQEDALMGRVRERLRADNAPALQWSSDALEQLGRTAFGIESIDRTLIKFKHPGRPRKAPIGLEERKQLQFRQKKPLALKYNRWEAAKDAKRKSQDVVQLLGSLQQVMPMRIASKASLAQQQASAQPMATPNKQITRAMSMSPPFPVRQTSTGFPPSSGGDSLRVLLEVGRMVERRSPSPVPRPTLLPTSSATTRVGPPAKLAQILNHPMPPLSSANTTTAAAPSSMSSWKYSTTQRLSPQPIANKSPPVASDRDAALSLLSLQQSPNSSPKSESGSKHALL